MKSFMPCVTLLVAVFMLTGCASRYVVPGRGADMAALAPQSTALSHDEPGVIADAPIDTRIARQPAATFPAAVAVIRVQAAGYSSNTASSYGTGRFCVVTTRDVETDEQIQRLEKLPQVAMLGTVNRFALPNHISSELDLRRAAAAIQADLTLLYTFDTSIRKEDNESPLDFFTLGFLPHTKAHVRSTASAVLLDTQTGYIYALAEGTGENSQLANSWTTRAAVDQSRFKAEAKAFDALIGEVERLWPEVVGRYAYRSHRD